MERIFEDLAENVSERCFNDIMGMVEELILERNQGNKGKKREWELKRGEEANYRNTSYSIHGGTGEWGIKDRENTIKDLKKSKDLSNLTKADAVNALARENRAVLGREHNPVSYVKPDEWDKNQGEKEDRTKQSQRGSAKDEYETGMNRQPSFKVRLKRGDFDKD